MPTSLFSDAITNARPGVVISGTATPSGTVSERSLINANNAGSRLMPAQQIDTSYIVNGDTAYWVSFILLNVGIAVFELGPTNTSTHSEEGPQLTDTAEDNIGFAIRASNGNEYKWRISDLVSADTTEPYTWNVPGLSNADYVALGAGTNKFIWVDTSVVRIDWDNLQYLSTPRQPDAPTLATIDTASISVTLSADPVSDLPITSRNIRYRTGTDPWTRVDNITSPHTIENLDPSTTYEVAWRATSDAGNGVWSPSATIDTASAADPAEVAATPSLGTTLSVSAAVTTVNPTPVTVTNAALLVYNWPTRTLWEITDTSDPGSGVQITNAFPTNVDDALGLTMHNGSLWVVDRGGTQLWKLDDIDDPSTAVNRGTLPTGIVNPRGIASYNGSIWIVDSDDDHLWEIPDAETPGTGTSHGALPSGLSGETSGLGYHNGSLWITELGTTDRLWEVTDPTSPGTAVNRGTFPTGIENPQAVVAYKDSLWIVDNNVDELWEVVTPTDATTAVSRGDLPTGLVGPQGIALRTPQFPSTLSVAAAVTVADAAPATPQEVAAMHTINSSLSVSAAITQVSPTAADVAASQSIGANFSVSAAVTLADAPAGPQVAVNHSMTTTLSASATVTLGETIIDVQNASLLVYNWPTRTLWEITDTDDPNNGEQITNAFPTNLDDGLGITMHNGSLWVVDRGGTQLWELVDIDDPSTAVSRGTLPAGIVSPRGIASYNGSIWIVDDDDSNLWEIPDAQTPGTGTSHGALPSGLNGETSGLGYHDGSLWITELGTTDRLWEVADPTSPENAVNRGTFPAGIENPQAVVGYKESLWIVDNNVDELWEVVTPNDATTAVSRGDLPANLVGPQGIALRTPQFTSTLSVAAAVTQEDVSEGPQVAATPELSGTLSVSAAITQVSPTAQDVVANASISPNFSASAAVTLEDAPAGPQIEANPSITSTVSVTAAVTVSVVKVPVRIASLLVYNWPTRTLWEITDVNDPSSGEQITNPFETRVNDGLGLTMHNGNLYVVDRGDIELWRLSNIDDPSTAVYAGVLPADLLNSRGIASHEGSLWIINDDDNELWEIPDATAPAGGTNHGSMPAGFTGDASGLGSYNGSLWVTEDGSDATDPDRLWEVTDPTSPGTATNRGEFPAGIVRPQGVVGYMGSLWVVDNSVDELWEVVTPTDPTSAVSRGDLPTGLLGPQGIALRTPQFTSSLSVSAAVTTSTIDDEDVTARPSITSTLSVTAPVTVPIIPEGILLSDASVTHFTPGVLAKVVGVPGSTDVGGVGVVDENNRSRVTWHQLTNSYIDGGGIAYWGGLAFMTDGQINLHLVDDLSETFNDAGPSFTETAEDNLYVVLFYGSDSAKWDMSVLDNSDEDDPYFFSAASVTAAGPTNDAAFRTAVNNATTTIALLVDSSHPNINIDDLTVLSVDAPGTSLFDDSITASTPGVALTGTTNPGFTDNSYTDPGSGTGVTIRDVHIVQGSNADRRISTPIDSTYIEGGGTAYLITLHIYYRTSNTAMQVALSTTADGSASGQQFTNHAGNNLAIAVQFTATHSISSEVLVHRIRFSDYIALDTTQPFTWRHNFPLTIMRELGDDDEVKVALVDTSNVRIDWDNLRYRDAPERPLAPTVTAIDSTSLSIRLPADPTSDLAITSRDIQWRQSGGAWTRVTGITSPYTLENLTEETAYEVQWRAVSSIGNSAWSPSGTATTRVGAAQVAATPSITSTVSVSAAVTTVSPTAQNVFTRHAITSTLSVSAPATAVNPSNEVSATHNMTTMFAVTAAIEAVTPMSHLEARPSITATVSVSAAVTLTTIVGQDVNNSSLLIYNWPTRTIWELVDTSNPGSATQITNAFHTDLNDGLGLTIHNGSLWVVDRNGDELWELENIDDPSTAVNRGELPTGIESPQGIASHEGRIWIVDNDTDELWVIPNPRVPNLGISRGSLPSSMDIPSGITSHNGSLFITERETQNKLWEVTDLNNPDAAIDRGTFPSEVTKVQGITSFKGSLWIIDNDIDELWEVVTPTDATTAVSRGDLPTGLGGAQGITTRTPQFTSTLSVTAAITQIVPDHIQVGISISAPTTFSVSAAITQVDPTDQDVAATPNIGATLSVDAEVTTTSAGDIDVINASLLVFNQPNRTLWQINDTNDPGSATQITNAFHVNLDDGIGLTMHGGSLWIVDRGGRELWELANISNPSTAVRRGTLPTGLTDPQGLASHNGSIWIVDGSTDTDDLWEIPNPQNPGTGTSHGRLPVGFVGNPAGIGSYNGSLWITEDGTTINRLWEIIDPTTPGDATNRGAFPSALAQPQGVVGYQNSLWVIDDSIDELWEVVTPTRATSAVSRGDLPAGLTSAQGITLVTTQITSTLSVTAGITLGAPSFQDVNASHSIPTTFSAVGAVTKATVTDQTPVARPAITGMFSASAPVAVPAIDDEDIVASLSIPTTISVVGGVTLELVTDQTPVARPGIVTTLSVAAAVTLSTIPGEDVTNAAILVYNWPTKTLWEITDTDNSDEGTQVTNAFPTGLVSGQGMTMHDGSLWIVDRSSVALWELVDLSDPSTAVNRGTLPTDLTGAQGIASYNGSIWIINRDGNDLWEIPDPQSPGTGTNRGTLPTDFDIPLGLTAYNDSLWVVEDGTNDDDPNRLWEITSTSSPSTALNRGTFPDGINSPRAIVAYKESLWIVDNSVDELWEIISENDASTAVKRGNLPTGITGPQGLALKSPQIKGSFSASGSITTAVATSLSVEVTSTIGAILSVSASITHSITVGQNVAANPSLGATLSVSAEVTQELSENVDVVASPELNARLNNFSPITAVSPADQDVAASYPINVTLSTSAPVTLSSVSAQDVPAEPTINFDLYATSPVIQSLVPIIEGEDIAATTHAISASLSVSAAVTLESPTAQQTAVTFTIRGNLSASVPVTQTSKPSQEVRAAITLSGVLVVAARVTTVNPTPPGPPPTPTVTSTPTGDLVVSWSPPSNTGSGVASYDLRYRESGTTPWTTETNVGGSFTITNLTDATTYQVQVRANNAYGGNGNWSSTGSGVTKKTDFFDTGAYRLQADWDRDGQYAHAMSNLWSYLVQTSIRTKRGRNYAAQIFGRSVAGGLTITLRNENDEWDRFNDRSQLSGYTIIGTPVRLMMEDVNNPGTYRHLWSGSIDKTDYKQRRGGQDEVTFSCKDIIVDLQLTDASAPARADISTESAARILLNAGNISDSSIGDIQGNFKMERWWSEEQSLLRSIRELEETEGGFFWVDEENRINFDNSTKRDTLTSRVSKLTIVDSES